MRNYDLEFLKRFSMVIGLLALVTLGLILLALYLHRQLPPEVSPTAASRTAARIHPVGAVYAGDTGAAAQAAAAAAAAAPPADLRASRRASLERTITALETLLGALRRD